MGSSGASKALAILEKRSRGGAVLTGLGVGVPNLLVLAGHTSVAVIVRESCWAKAFASTRIKNEVAGAR